MWSCIALILAFYWESAVFIRRTIALRTVDGSTSGFTMLSHRQQHSLSPLLDNRLLSAVNHHVLLLKPVDGSCALSVSGTVVWRWGGSTRHYCDLAFLQRTSIEGQPCVCSGPLCSSLSCCRLWWDQTTSRLEDWLVYSGKWLNQWFYYISNNKRLYFEVVFFLMS